MSMSSAHADCEKAFSWQIEPLGFNNVEKKREETELEGKLKQKEQEYKDDNII